MSATRPMFGDAAARLEALDWQAIELQLDARGWAIAHALLDGAACRRIAATYEDESRFRGKVVMQSHGFGRGEYQ